ncbi:hypothetical protein ZEAMMB73_Zm00001d040701 [Zea mays]|uniref:Uncharacterized protein n=1 Tax=Zea mays TaxID=4577 RepID=A0A1D6MSB9_MAIZE|nr:hypothetical protein ZEAMMB73_Zm00001d040701 [Zea mays]
MPTTPPPAACRATAAASPPTPAGSASEDYLFHLVHPDGLADHALWPAYPPDYVAATRDFGRARPIAALVGVGLLVAARLAE